ncbi:hypothetical protein ABS71_03240 [bacterium SCN 62-11]|nr:hypothetical protein [Candidatus Eremiobacteraeota bacterium]ODT76619.1 MAG: hypothetical protein ABS71_03240 [bacterium SCN 62-11]
MNIQNSFQTPWSAYTPAINFVRPMGQPTIPSVRPIEPIETPAAPAVEPQVALKSWLSQYSNGRDHGLYERVSADPSSEGTLFRRGLMISGVVSLAG